MMTRKPTKNTKPFWERGYDTHGYWQKKKKVGWVALEGKGMNCRYRWQAGNRAGEAKTLAEAKREVERTLEFGARQLGLFDAGEAG